MKIIALFGVAAMAVASLSATPADAQRRGWDDRDGPRGYHDRGWRDDDRRGWRWDDRRDWRGDDRRDWRGNDRRWYDGGRGRGWRGGYRGRTRVVCQIERGYYGPVRRCYDVRR